MTVLADRIATPDGKRRYVRALFATIAERYDFITVALSYGQDRRWKRRVIALALPRAGVRVLDLATGTGDLAYAAAAQGARVVGLDITQRMIELARAKRARRREPADGVRRLRAEGASASLAEARANHERAEAGSLQPSGADEAA